MPTPPSTPDAPDAAAAKLGAVEELLDVLGFAATETATADDHDEIDALVRKRVEARADRDFATADRIRDELAERGVTIEDSASGSTWHR